GWSAPAEFRGDIFEDRLDDMGVIVHAELVRHGQKQGVGFGNRLVAGKLPDEFIRLGGVGPAEDGTCPGVDIADRILLLAAAAEIGPVAIVDERENAAADRDAWRMAVAGRLPGFAISADLRGLLDMEGLARFVVF